tara:strand:+ start:620 stop:2209 length:1590 start_codon:yes stop_codon:yes gene_type:complete
MNFEKETYLGNAQVKKDGVQQAWTKKDIKEYQKCMKDPVYFAEKYGKVINLDRGLVPFEMYPYQKKMFEHFESSRFSIVLACRQSGKSISSCMYILWYALFHADQTIAVLANKGATAREMLARITLALENVPFFLQPGTKALNKGSLEFSNNSRIIAAATSGSSIRGLSVNLLFLDEFAFVENAAQFYTSTYPVISSGKTSRVIITSTANGIGNTFHKIYEGAVQETNEFKSFRVDWWDVPGRDDEWKQQTISNTSELQFQQEFGNTFFGTGNTLIAADALLNMKASMPLEDKGDVRIYEQPKPGHDYIITVDVAKGRGQDYSTFNVIDITQTPFKQVAIYKNNLVSPILFPSVIHKWAKTYNDAYVIVESNDAGSVVANGLYYDIEYENVHVESMIKANAIGVTMNRKIKQIGCSNLKDLIEENKLELLDIDTISECSTFEAKGNSFEASSGNHDDLVMNLVMFAWYVGTESFINQSDLSIRQMLYDEKIKAIEEEITPVGFIDDGIENEKREVNGGDVWFETRTGMF